MPLTYEAYLENASAEDLKRFAGVWIGKEARKLSKEPARAAITATMAKPAAIRTALAGLTDLERAGLALVKVRGQLVDTDAIAGALLMLGLPFPNDTSYGRYSGGERYFGALESLLRSGSLMLHRTFSVETLRTHVDPYRQRAPTFADARVLAEAEVSPPPALDVKPVRGRAGTAKTPGEVALRLIATAEGISRVGGIALTAAGRIAKPSASKLAKTVAWKGDSGPGALTALADASELFLQLWLASGLLMMSPTGRTIVLVPEAATLLDRPYDEQAPLWARAYESLTGWYEYIPKGARFYGDDDEPSYKTFNALRGALLVAIAALPDPDAWYATRDLADAMYARGGARLVLGSAQGYHAPYDAKPDAAARHYERWMHDQHERWNEREAQWIERALAGPLYHLGLVEIASSEPKRGQPAQVFRLTPAGRRALWDVYRPETSRRSPRPDPAAEAGCWVVQPNFEVVVFFDAATPGQLRFIERVGERLGTEGAAATYRLTRESVYGALESGMTLGSMLDTFAESARYPVPDAVIRTVTGWAARRERLAVRRDVHVLEFDDATARDAALAKGRIKGDAVGDRFILLAERSRPRTVRGVIDYEAGPTRCLTVAEDGLVSVTRAKRDLLVGDEVAAWCEPASKDGSRWRLTRESVARAAARGWKPDAIHAQLARRTIRGVPALVRIAVEAWAGGNASRRPVAAADAPVLLVGDDAIADAVAESETTRGFLECRLGPRAFLVKPADLDALRAALAALGLAVGRDASDEKVVRAVRDDSE